MTSFADLRQRARQAWFPLTFVVMLAWVDWIMHRSLPFIVVVGGATVAAILYRRELAQRLNFPELMAGLSPVLQALICAAPALLYYLVRARGTTGAASVVVVLVTCGAVAGVAIWGRQIDARLNHFYRARDRLLPFNVRAALVLVLPILAAFTIIHGNLGDVGALVGGSTSAPRGASGLTGEFLFATVTAVVISMLLMRKAK